MTDLDRLIDGGLATYAGEPAADLASRVLRAKRRRTSWLGFAAAAAAAAGLVFALWPTRVNLAEPPLVASRIAVPVLDKRVAPVVPSKPLPLPVPVPSGLTREERQLAAFAAASPELAVLVLVEAPRRMAEPIEIAPLAIEPLAAPE